jgi:hypothetical protein
MKAMRPSPKTRPLQKSLSRSGHASETVAASPRIFTPRPVVATNKARAARIKRAALASAKATRIRLAKRPPNIPHKRELWRDVSIPKTRDISVLMPASLPRGERFETFADAARTDEKRIARLMPSRPDLAAEIERYEVEGARFLSPISARAARRYRRYDTAERLRIAEMFEGLPLQIATVYLDAFDAGDLRSADMKLEHDAFRKKLRRARFEGVILIGGTEVAWLWRQERWILHLHLLAIGVTDAVEARLRASLPDASPAAALKVQALEDPAEQISYCQKYNSTYMPGKRGPTGRAPARPLPRERLVEWAEWMAQHKFPDFGFLYGARRHGGRIVPKAQVAEALSRRVNAPTGRTQGMPPSLRARGA